MDLKNSVLTPYLPLLFQITRFVIVGTFAALIHFGIVVSLVEIGVMKPLTANVIAFLVAFQVSYWGQRYWTFSGTTVSHSVAMLRLLLVASSHLIANQALFFIFLTLFKLPYMLALLFTLAIFPIVTFVLGKFWIFR